MLALFAVGFAIILFSRFLNNEEMFQRYQQKMTSSGVPTQYISELQIENAGFFGKYTVLFFAGAIVVLCGMLFVFVPMYNSIKKERQIAETASRTKSLFLSNMSHEIRTPMNAIIGMTQIARSSDDPGKIRECLEQVEISSRHLLSLINDVLDISKIESGKLELSNEEFSPERLLQDVGRMIKGEVEKKKQSLSIEIGEHIPGVVLADRFRITQVLMNLLSNAVKFTDDGGRIILKLDSDPAGSGAVNLRFSVSDNGIGISPDQMERLFVSFQQADSSITKRFGGTGLGLAIAQKIVNLAGGNITVESEFGKGSEFSFGWPCAVSKSATDAAATREEPPEEEPPDIADLSYEGKTALIVEDIEINQIVLQSMLETAGITTEVAWDGEEAVGLFERNPDLYDIIFMDVQMPKMDGYTATKRIRSSGRERGKTVPIVAMTANAFREDIDMALESGMNMHISKPLEEEKVVESLRKYV